MSIVFVCDWSVLKCDFISQQQKRRCRRFRVRYFEVIKKTLKSRVSTKMFCPFYDIWEFPIFWIFLNLNHILLNFQLYFSPETVIFHPSIAFFRALAMIQIAHWGIGLHKCGSHISCHGIGVIFRILGILNFLKKFRLDFWVLNLNISNKNRIVWTPLVKRS